MTWARLLALAAIAILSLGAAVDGPVPAAQRVAALPAAAPAALAAAPGTAPAAAASAAPAPTSAPATSAPEAPANASAAGSSEAPATPSSAGPSSEAPTTPSSAGPSEPPATPAAAARPAASSTPQGRVEVPPPPFTDGIFPCSSCHGGMEPNRTPRVLTEMHTDIVLRHDETHRWCLDCHDATNRDVLHLASGEPVPFEESYRLCGQCHGEKYRDWRAGVHGRRSGSWNGHKTYLLCAHCHNPHAPRFQALEPKPAPVPPARPGR